jgi:hypothetical protein
VSLAERIHRLELAAPPPTAACRCPFDYDAAVAVLGGDAPGDRCRRCGDRRLAVPVALVPYSPDAAGFR